MQIVSQVLSRLTGLSARMTAAPLIINGTAAPPSTSDIFSGFDTFGWPPEPPPWINPQRGSLLVVLTLYAAYNPATDVRRAVQAKFLSTPETFVLPQIARPLIINGTAATPYNPATDVQRLSQPKLFTAPEVFIQPQTAKPLLINGSAPPYNAGIDVQRLAQPKVFSIPEAFINPWLPRPLLINGTAPIPYNPATDVQRKRMAITFSTPESFPRPAPFNQLIVNGHGAPVPNAVLEFANGIDIYDGLNGTIKIAWGQFTPTPQSVNIYVNGILNQTVPFSALQATVTGLTHASYSPSAVAAPSGNGPRPQNMPPNGVVTPSQTYLVSVVAVSNGLERGQIERLVTVSPTSVMLVTPMKRLWPFPSSGLD